MMFTLIFWSSLAVLLSGVIICLDILWKYGRLYVTAVVPFGTGPSTYTIYLAAFHLHRDSNTVDLNTTAKSVTLELCFWRCALTGIRGKYLLYLKMKFVKNTLVVPESHVLPYYILIILLTIEKLYKYYYIIFNTMHSSDFCNFFQRFLQKNCLHKIICESRQRH